jgi:hypothetical protein
VTITQPTSDATLKSGDFPYTAKGTAQPDESGETVSGLAWWWDSGTQNAAGPGSVVPTQVNGWHYQIKGIGNPSGAGSHTLHVQATDSDDDPQDAQVDITYQP